MRYSSDSAIDRTYREIARLSWVKGDYARAISLADALIEDGAHDSWARVWRAYAALHYELTPSAYDRALKLLAGVDHPPEARAAALVLTAEIANTSAIEEDRPQDLSEQFRLLTEALELAPKWPSIYVRLADAHRLAGNLAEARHFAARALKLIPDEPTDDHFEVVITGRGVDASMLKRGLRENGLLKDAR